MGDSFGTLFRVHTWGESHGGGVGAVVEGCPAGVQLDLNAVQHQLARRRPGQSALVSQRKEGDVVQIMSGLQDGVTLGTPISLVVLNKDARPSAYTEMQDAFRPSHADYTWQAKHGIRAASGGGRASARETVSRVAAGAIARQLLAASGIEIVAWVDQVGHIALSPGDVDESTIDEALVDVGPTRCPVPEAAGQMEELIRSVRAVGDTVGGAVRCVVRGLPAGLGEPVFDKLHADLAKACMSLPATRGFEIGSGFASMSMRGSSHNDAFEPDGSGGVRTRTNHSGGVQGGISNGEPLRLRLAFKPVSTIFIEQDTVTPEGEATRLKPKGRHDPCVLPRAVPMVEAMIALVLIDHQLRHRARAGF
jgi:chorismate synthase